MWVFMVPTSQQIRLWSSSSCINCVFFPHSYCSKWRLRGSKVNAYLTSIHKMRVILYFTIANSGKITWVCSFLHGKIFFIFFQCISGIAIVYYTADMFLGFYCCSCLSWDRVLLFNLALTKTFNEIHYRFWVPG